MTVRKNGVVLPEFFAQRMKSFFWLPIARDKSDCPITDLLSAGVPLVGPGKENGTSKSAFDHAIDMPAQHFGLIALAMPDRVHPEIAKNDRTISSKTLQKNEITLAKTITV